MTAARQHVASLVKLESKLKPLLKSNPAPNNSAGRLEKIPIPTFSGDFEEYPAWKDEFNGLVGNVEPDTLRTYMIKSLKGDAAEWVK